MPEKTTIVDGDVDDAAIEKPNIRNRPHQNTPSPSLRPLPPSQPPVLKSHTESISLQHFEPARDIPEIAWRRASQSPRSSPPAPSRAPIPSPPKSGLSERAGGNTLVPSSPQVKETISHSPRIPSGSQRSHRDLEKADTFGHQSPHSHRSPFPPQSHDSHHTNTIYTTYEEDDAEDHPKQHAMWILIYLSAIAPFLALAISLYAIAATVIIVVLSPLCLCVTSSPLKTIFRRFLAPPLSLQLGLIFSGFEIDEPSFGEPAMLILVNILAPIYSLGVMLAAWVAAGFWFFAAILGEPNKDSEKEKADDGKITVLYVRGWWERWLIRGLR